MKPMMDALKDKKKNAMKIEIEISPNHKEEDENKKMGLAPDLKEEEDEGEVKLAKNGDQEDSSAVDLDDDMMDAKNDKKMRMEDAAKALKGNMDENDEIQFERMIDKGEQPKSLLDKARFKMYADKKGYESK